jgi:glyoxylase-like metal-dependent hydrolase (beta-lactamase superfamily II)
MIGLPCLGIRELLSAYVLTGEKNAVFEAGTTNTAPLLLEGLSRLGIRREDIDYLIVSHIHLDHAGGAGFLAGELPSAKVMVHETGARHLIDPSRLIASTKKVFGEKKVMDLYGEIIPIPAERVISLRDGDVVDLGGGRRLKVIHTPGHAPHHLSLYDPLTKGVFSGEALGVWADDIKVFSPSTPMPDFNLDHSIASILRLLEYDAEIIYFSHYGCTEDVQNTLYKIIGQLLCWGQIVRSGPEDDAGGRLARYVLEKEWAQWDSVRLAEEKGRKDIIEWMTWRTAAVLAPGIINFYRQKQHGKEGDK